MSSVNGADHNYIEVSIGEGEIESCYTCDLVFDKEAVLSKQAIISDIGDEDPEDSSDLVFPVSSTHVAECRPGTVHQKSDYQFHFRASLSIVNVDSQSNVEWLAKAFRYAVVFWLTKPFSQWLAVIKEAQPEGFSQYDPKKWSNREIPERAGSVPKSKYLLKSILPKQRHFLPGMPGLSGGSLMGGGFLIQDELYQPSAPVVENLPTELLVIDFTHNAQIQAVLIEVLDLLSVLGDSALTEVGLDLSYFEGMALGELMHYRNLLRDYLERLEQNGLLEEVANTPSAVVFREFVLMILADLDEFQRIQSVRVNNPNPPVTSRPQSLAGEILSRLRYLRSGESSKKLKLAIMQAYIAEVEKYRPSIEKKIEQEVADFRESERFQRMTREERKLHIEKKKQEVLGHLIDLEKGSSYWERTMRLILSNRLDVLTADLADVDGEPVDMDGKEKSTSAPPPGNDDEVEEDNKEEQPDEEPDTTGNHDHSSDGNRDPHGDGATEELSASGHGGFLIQNPLYTSFLADLFSSYHLIEEGSQDTFIASLIFILGSGTENFQQKHEELRKRLIKLFKEEVAYSHLQQDWETLGLDELIKLILDHGRYAYLTQEVMKLYTEQDAEQMLSAAEDLNMGRQSIQVSVTDPQQSDGLVINFSHNRVLYDERSTFISLLRERLERLELHTRIMSLTRSKKLSFSEVEIRRWREQCARDGQRLPIIFRYLVEGQAAESYVLGDTANLISDVKKRFPKIDITGLEAEKKKASGARKLQLERQIAELRSESARNAGIETSAKVASVCELPEILDPQLPGLEVLLYMVLNQDSPNSLRGAVFGTDRLLGRDNLLGFLMPEGWMISPSNREDTIESATPVVVELTSSGRLKLLFHKEFDTWVVPDSKKQLDGVFTVSMEYEFQITGQQLKLEYSGFSYTGHVRDDVLEEGREELERKMKERSANFRERMIQRVGASDKKPGELQQRFDREQLGDSKKTVEWSEERVRAINKMWQEINAQMIEIEQANLRSWSRFQEYYRRLESMMASVEWEYKKLLDAEKHHYENTVKQFVPESLAAREYAQVHQQAEHYRERLIELEKQLARMKSVSRQTEEELGQERVRYLQASEELEAISYDVDIRGALYKQARALPPLEQENLLHLFESVKLMVSHATLTVTEKLSQLSQEKIRHLSTPSKPSALNRNGSQSQEDLLQTSQKKVSEEGRRSHGLRRNARYRSEGAINWLGVKTSQDSSPSSTPGRRVSDYLKPPAWLGKMWRAISRPDLDMNMSGPREFSRDGTMRDYSRGRANDRLTDYPVVDSVFPPNILVSSPDSEQNSNGQHGSGELLGLLDSETPPGNLLPFPQPGFHSQLSMLEGLRVQRDFHEHTLSASETIRYRVDHRRSDSQLEIQLLRVSRSPVQLSESVRVYLSAYAQDPRFIRLISGYVETDFHGDLRSFAEDLKLYVLNLPLIESSALEPTALEQQVANLLNQFIDSMGEESLANALTRILGEQILKDLQRIFPSATDV
ncbi:hypothetical protein GZ78_22505 [Endozoicomonas numazuensis]|uniref:Uncharacterized protein n=2 Tax=Endozoicomonas numazuensis TaxID=1137799 RepID=A0A081NDT0_9GAMM|nr:hypothetical protein GZ78_22505 [Endozoicomonas numazuensis]